MGEKRFVIAVRNDKRESAPEDWQQILAAIEGVSVEGAAGNHAQFSAGEAALQRVVTRLGEWFRIEEVSQRGPL